jgi:hypothetical protein
MMEMPEARANASRLEVLEQLATEAGAENIAAESRALAERVREGLFYAVCVGQFKRGKSTLVNALVGEPVLPTGIVPVTSVVTVLRYGKQCAARVRLADGAWESIAPSVLAAYVSEAKNPENTKGVAAVEVFTQSPLLASGMCLVDTPGIGSVFAGNTRATRDFVPHVDAALIVLGADPPISAEELELVEELGRQCQDLFFILNKADRLSDADLNEAVAFTRRVLTERLGRSVTAIFDVSATDRLAGTGSPRGWSALIDALKTLAQCSGSELVRVAEDRGTGLLATRLHHHLDETRGALLRPLEESERRIDALRACVTDAERSLNDLGCLFTAEQERLSRIFADKKEEFLARALPSARRELAEAIRNAEIQQGPALRDKSIDLAHEISKRWLDRWLAEAQPAAESLYVQATQRFVDLANGFLDKLASSGDPALAGLQRTVTSETGFRVRSRLYYVSLMTLTGQTPAGWFLDLLRSREQQKRALARQVGAYLDTLIFTNANRIANDFRERVLESRRRFQGEIHSVLLDLVASAERALGRANERKSRGTEAVREEVNRIDTLNRRLETLDLETRNCAP